MATNPTPSALRPAKVFPPGNLIAEELEERGMTQAELATLMQMSEKSINQIIAGKQGITPETAHKLSIVFTPSSPEFWLNMENRYQLFLQKENESVRLTQQKVQLNELLPVASLTKMGWLPQKPSIAELLNSACQFLGLQSMDEFHSSGRLAVNYRHSTKEEGLNPQYRHAWFLAAKQQASLKPLSVPYNANALRQLAEAMPAYTREPQLVAEFLHKLENEVGVRFLLFEHFDKTRTDGAAFLLASGHPVIVYTGRYGWLDHFWFTVAHELAHVVLHLDDDHTGFVDDMDGDQDTDRKEQEANEMASAWLQTRNAEQFLPQHVKYPKLVEIEREAYHRGIHPSILLGALHHSGRLERKVGVQLRVKILKHIPDVYWVRATE